MPRTAYTEQIDRATRHCLLKLHTFPCLALIQGRQKVHLVSVIIPAHNAATSIERTLESVMAQSHSNVEVIVVDDGSTDATVQIAYAFANAPFPLRVLSTPNQGVARARNLAISHAKGSFIAPLDADDLWHPLKLESQLKAFERSDRRVALVYNWFRRIDEQDVVIEGAACPDVEGFVIHRHLMWNFISNGSTPLIRREILERVAYEPGLQDNGHQGCEDYLMQLQIASHAHFACVPEFLTGYRRTTNAMSGNVARMIQSHIHALLRMRNKVGLEGKTIIDQRVANFRVQYARNRLRRLQFGPASSAMAMAIRTDARSALGAVCDQFRLALGTTSFRRNRPIGPPRPFSMWDVKEGHQPWRPMHEKRLDELRRFDLLPPPDRRISQNVDDPTRPGLQ